MKGQDEFKNDMLAALPNIINTYHLTIVNTDHHHIQLAARDFALEIGFVREGLETSCFDLRPRTNRHDFALGHYLVQVLHVPLPADYVRNDKENYLLGLWRHEMPWLVYVLENYAQDILSGDRRWQATYQFPYTDAADGRYGEALKVIERRSEHP